MVREELIEFLLIIRNNFCEVEVPSIIFHEKGMDVDSTAFREGKKAVWDEIEQYVDPDIIASVLELNTAVKVAQLKEVRKEEKEITEDA